MHKHLRKCNGDRTVRQLAEGLGLGSTPTGLLLDVAWEFFSSATTASEAALWYQCNKVLSKFSCGSSEDSSRLRNAAVEAFFKAEATCRETNGRLVDIWTRPNIDLDVFARARRLISGVLGSRFPWESFPWECGFGPGASSGLRRKASAQQYKWVLSSHITEAALPYYHAFRRWAGLADLPHTLTVVGGNTVTTVPKSWKTDRTIAIEPDWNAFLQKGVGGLIRSRLQRRGLLLPDAQDYHAQLARLGSWTGHLATIDLSAASDSVSLALCEALLPDEWFRVLMDLRSPSGTIDGKVIVYEKISSMGNGFTFELETLIFWALTQAACSRKDSRDITVYGDDIICPSYQAERVIDVLRQAGFTLNKEKSFTTGPFRESCGGHYWRGVDITPVYCKAPPETMGETISLANQLYGWVVRFPEHRDRVQAAYRSLARQVPRELCGPLGLDGCLWSDWDACRPTWRRDFQSYRQRVVQRSHRFVDLCDHEGAFLFKLWNSSTELRSSKLAKATTVEKTVNVFVDRESWSMLPVRLA